MTVEMSDGNCVGITRNYKCSTWNIFRYCLGFGLQIGIDGFELFYVEQLLWLAS